MDEILSQNEISELLKAVEKGAPAVIKKESARSKVHLYNFQTANKFTKEQIKTIRIIHENFGNHLANVLSAALRTTVEIEMASVEEQIFSEFSYALPPFSMLAILEMPPLSSYVIFHISQPIAYGIVNRTLGGSSTPSSGQTTNRNFTEIEIALIERIIHKLTISLETSWSKIVRVKPNVNRIETSPQMANIVSLNEAVIVVTYNTIIDNEVQGPMMFCIPQLALESVAKLLTTTSLFTIDRKQDNTPPRKGQIKNILSETSLDITAQLTPTPATISDIVDLKVGDVLRLNHKVDDPVSVKVGHFDKFIGKWGIHGKSYAVKIAEVIHEEDFMEEEE